MEYKNLYPNKINFLISNADSNNLSNNDYSFCINLIN